MRYWHIISFHYFSLLLLLLLLNLPGLNPPHIGQVHSKSIKALKIHDDSNNYASIICQYFPFIGSQLFTAIFHQNLNSDVHSHHTRSSSYNSHAFMNK